MSAVDARPVVLNRSERREVEGAAGVLERKRFMKAAEVLRGIVERWDGASDFTVVHRSAIAGRPDPDGERVS